MQEILVLSKYTEGGRSDLAIRLVLLILSVWLFVSTNRRFSQYRKLVKDNFLQEKMIGDPSYFASKISHLKSQILL